MRKRTSKLKCTFDMRVYIRVYWPSSCAACAHMRAAAAQIRSIVSARVHSIYARAHVRAYMHLDLDLHMHVLWHAYIYICTCTCVCAYMHACTKYKLNGRLVRARASTSRIPALVQVRLRVHEHNGCTLQYAHGARMYKLKLIDQAYTRAHSHMHTHSQCVYS